MKTTRAPEAALVLLLAAAIPQSARPCSLVPRCTPVVVVPVDHAPANLTEIRFEAGWTCRGAPSPPFSEPVLETAGGIPVHTTLETDRLQVHEPLRPGQRYRVRFVEWCPGETTCSYDGRDIFESEPPREVAHDFVATAAAPPPTNLGRVALASQTMETLPVWTNNGSCTVEVETNAIVLAIEPSSDLAPWLPLTTFEIWVDDESRGTTPYGHTSSHSLGEGGLAWGPTLLWTQCQEVTGWSGTIMEPGRDFSAGLAPGLHRVRVVARVVGLDLMLEESIEVELGCENRFDRGEFPPPGEVKGCSSASGKTLPALLLLGLMFLPALARIRLTADS